MKKVLLATTALTLSAGFASADVSISGSAETGIHSTAVFIHLPILFHLKEMHYIVKLIKMQKVILL
jgi:hypothetical protein